RASAADEAATKGDQAQAHEHQAPQKNRRMERRLSRHSLGRFSPLTRIRSPALVVRLLDDRKIAHVASTFLRSSAEAEFSH
ncbi:hypothetical protein, partial [Methylosinus sp. RM1]|uniref:hypothetical protein n=1 Tax=Methylosinus sp. RM1 TaxID=2583817 RepID=UPI001A9C53D8